MGTIRKLKIKRNTNPSLWSLVLDLPQSTLLSPQLFLFLWALTSFRSFFRFFKSAFKFTYLVYVSLLNFIKLTTINLIPLRMPRQADSSWMFFLKKQSQFCSYKTHSVRDALGHNYRD